ncbi:Oxidase ustYa [Colletotrichum siamense]|uniref:Oxidase ustYa n=1 Tax=Colletotrichum siamense TaxID=690259 RepID=A0A9P5EJF5_COLSI|nr:Oxidase ustYa [Colletotrichum siamense]KAF4850122.1 Oxidase ustYa [Colletotrichum siamense]
MDNKEDSRSSTETSTMDEEKQILLECSETLEQTTPRPKHSPFITTRVAILLLVLSNIAFVTALDLILRSQSSSSLPTWMPPERTAKKLFMYQSVFGGEPDAKSEEMWTKLIPMGKRWINVTADTDEIPYYPGMDRSVPKQRALVAVFHQLHCLYMTRSGYFAARDGKLSTVNTTHLSHCWDYLRQSIMCSGDTTLEWLPPKGVGSTGWGYQHTCRDYEALYIYAEQHRSSDKKVIHE